MCECARLSANASSKRARRQRLHLANYILHHQSTRLRVRQALQAEDAGEATRWMKLVQDGKVKEILSQLAK